MSVALVAIKFNHDTASARTDALNIRINATQPAPLPEWQQGMKNDSAHSIAAYAIDETRGSTLTIRAKLAIAGGQRGPVEIRALSPRPAPPPQGWLESLLSPLSSSPAVYQYYLQRYRDLWASRSRAEDILGDVKARPVAFRPNDESEFELFELSNVKLSDRGVGVHDLKWRWQSRQRSSDPWIDFTETTHRIYAVLRTPTDPWQREPYDHTNTQLPWTDVLDFACQWARGSKTVDEAARRVTASVYRLGPNIIEYDCPGWALTNYTLMAPQEGFACSAFIQRLRGNMFYTRYVNCVDCATMVSSFANALGCDLSQAGMYSDLGVPFALNPIRAIGSAVWQTPCSWGGFSYHEVAWKDPCTMEAELFDACLLIDADRAPARPPHTALLPANIRFDRYRDRLVLPADRRNCEPQPATTRRRRPVF